MSAIEPIPDIIPERSITGAGVHWPAADSRVLPLNAGHVHTSAGIIPLPEIALAGDPVSQARLVDSLKWDQIAAAMIAHVQTPTLNGEVLLLAVHQGEDLVAVAVPAVVLEDAAGQPEFRAFLAHELRTRVQSGVISVVEDNLDRLLAYADQFHTFAAQAGLSGQPVLPPGPGAFDATRDLMGDQARPENVDWNDTSGWQNRKGSIFRFG